MGSRIKVMLTTEGTYPFHQGGVSTWCDILVQKLNNEVDYVIFSVIMNPFVTQKFSLPNNTQLIKVPLWGTEEPSEHLNIPFSQVYLSKRVTTEKTVRENFIPLFSVLIEEIMSDVKDEIKFGRTLYAMHEYFQEYEYKKSFKAEVTWNTFKDIVLKYSMKPSNSFDTPNVYSLIQSIGWIYRFLNILNTPLPSVDVVHSAAAAFCGVPGVLAKIKNGTPFMLTEHGVYLREQYLSLARRNYSSFLNKFFIRMIQSVVSLNYAYADQVSPVCRYNTRWEKKLGVKDEKIEVIYNGVDKDVFTPGRGMEQNKTPTVVTVARIDPFKDILTLIRTAALVKEKFGDIKFIVYGSITVDKYYKECKALKKELGLEENFIFAGHTTNAPEAYRGGDVIVLSSKSEAFPYSIVEAMMCGKVVVATDVGGIREAVGDTGIVVNPGKPDELAAGIIKLLHNPDLRESMGDEARQRALNLFSIEKVLEHHLQSYLKLLSTVRVKNNSDTTLRQGLYMDRGYAFMYSGFYKQAIVQFELAIRADYHSSAVPVIMMAIAQTYNRMGEYDKAFCELYKAEIIMRIEENRMIA